MNSKKIFSERFNNSPFIIALTKEISPLFVRYLNEVENMESNGDFYATGTKKERYLKSIMLAVGVVQSYFEDLEKVKLFLKADPEILSMIHGNDIQADEYYKYHYDNFIIRIVTSIDICGKIGNILFDLGIKERYSNWHSFAYHPKIKGTDCSNILIKFSNYLENFRNQRHEKIHQGKNQKSNYDKIVFWSSINKFIGKDSGIEDEMLNEYTKSQIEDSLQEIENTISKTVEYIFTFINSTTNRLNEIIKS